VTLAPFGSLPGSNPFWAVRFTDAKTVNNLRYHLSVNPNPDRPLRPLRLARSSPPLKEEQRHEDDGIRIYAQRVYFRCLRLDNQDIAHSVMSSRIEHGTNLYARWVEKCMDWQKDWQFRLLRSVDPAFLRVQSG